MWFSSYIIWLAKEFAMKCWSKYFFYPISTFFKIPNWHFFLFSFFASFFYLSLCKVSMCYYFNKSTKSHEQQNKKSPTVPDIFMFIYEINADEVQMGYRDDIKVHWILFALSILWMEFFDFFFRLFQFCKFRHARNNVDWSTNDKKQKKIKSETEIF